MKSTEKKDSQNVFWNAGAELGHKTVVPEKVEDSIKLYQVCT